MDQIHLDRFVVAKYLKEFDVHVNGLASQRANSNFGFVRLSEATRVDAPISPNSTQFALATLSITGALCLLTLFIIGALSPKGEGTRREVTKSISIKGPKRKSSGCAPKVNVLTP